MPSIAPPDAPKVKPELGHGSNQHTPGPDNIRSSPEYGTSAEYLVRRLKRDAPEIAAELARGELPSARVALDAAVTAGRTQAERARAHGVNAEMLRPPKPMPGEARNPHGANQYSEAKGYNITQSSGSGDSDRPRGTSAAYLAAKLKRDAPEFAAQLAEGAFRSVRAACKAAGIVKVPTPGAALRSATHRYAASGRATCPPRFAADSS